MAFEFSDFSVLTEYLTQYLLGETAVIGILIFLAIFLYMTMSGVPATVGLSVVLPLTVAFQASGWLGANRYIIALILVVIGIVLSNLLIRLYSR